MSDWSNGSIKGAMIKFILTSLSLIIIPLAIYHGMAFAVEQMAEYGMDGIISSGEELLPVMEDVVDRVVFYSIPLVILSIPIGFYARGNRARIPFRFAFAVYIVIWIWLVASGGVYTMTMQDMTFGEFTVKTMDITLDLVYIIYTVMGIGLLKALLAFTEYRAYHEEYLEKLQKKEERKRRKNGISD